MAEKLLVPAAKILALERLRTGVDDILGRDSPGIIATPALVGLIDELYTNLLEADVAIKEPICLLIAMKRLDSGFWERLSPLMRKHGALATGVTNYINLLIPSNLVTWKLEYTDGIRYSRIAYFEQSILEKPEEEMRQKWMEKERSQCNVALTDIT
ncbi:hypothetical protein PspLS_11921 [Pyricularia sp. CBS 133598]|nr:hypothetical protein PspLS_11921 [Pyricularia sp. CBS 133598]